MEDLHPVRMRILADFPQLCTFNESQVIIDSASSMVHLRVIIGFEEPVVIIQVIFVNVADGENGLVPKMIT